MSPEPTRHANTLIFPASLDPKAVSVVRRLAEAGYESYLVGGCVRDLMLGRIPKDFDVSTEARPRQIRRLFRNCRVIGRRFKLAHVHFGDQIIEVATFRRNPAEVQDDDGAAPGPEAEAGPDTRSSGRSRRGDDRRDRRRRRRDGHEDPRDRDEDGHDEGDADADDLLIVRDNVYGTAEEDARRRDFTINALLYDVQADEVIDYVGGVPDLEQRVLRTIGDPDVRIAEDPVRMLRAVKFSSRLDLRIDDALDATMRRSADLIARSAPPRVLEEIYKLLTCGRAGLALGALLDLGLLDRLLPEVAAHWREHGERLVAYGDGIDRVDEGRRRVGNGFLLAVLFHDPWRAQCEEQPAADPLVLARELVAPAALRMSISRREVAILKQILLAVLRLEHGKRGRRFRMSEFLRRDTTADAIDLLYVRALMGAVDPELHAQWIERWALQERPEAHAAEPGADPEERSRRTRRRRRGGRRRRGRRGASARAEDGAPPADDADRAGGEVGPPATAPAEERKRSPASTRGGDGKGSSRDRPRDRRAEPATDAPREATPATGRDDPGPGERAPTAGAAGPGDGAIIPDPRTSEPPSRAGLRSLVRSLLHRITGRGGDAPEEDASAGTEGTSDEPARNTRSRPGRAEPPAAGRPPSARGADRAREDEPGPRREAKSEAGSAPPGGEGEASRPPESGRKRRRRRGGRRRRKPQGAGSAPAAGSGGSDGGGTDDRSEPAGAGEAGGGEGDRSRRRRRRGAKGNRRPGGERGRRGKGKKGPGEKGPDKKGRSGSGSGERRSRKDSSPSEIPAENGPAQRHPEDVEDIFDW